MVVELLVLRDVEAALGQEAGDSVDNAGTFRTRERQDKRGRVFPSVRVDTANRKVIVE
jgi:hypothetical protein